jgi:hypothetical protein
MSREVELFNANNVVVTDKRFSAGHRRFSMEDIRSVEVIYRARTWTPLLTLLLTAASFEAFGVSLEESGLQLTAVALLMLAATVFWKGGPRYSIALDTKDGHATPLTSSDRVFVETLGQVMQFTLERTGERAAPARDVFSLAAERRAAFRVVPGKVQVNRDSRPVPMAHGQLFTMRAPVSHSTTAV